MGVLDEYKSLWQEKILFLTGFPMEYKKVILYEEEKHSFMMVSPITEKNFK